MVEAHLVISNFWRTAVQAGSKAKGADAEDGRFCTVVDLVGGNKICPIVA